MASPRLLLSSAALTVALAAPAAAQASPSTDLAVALTKTLPAAATTADPRCGDEAETKPFSRWADVADYVPAPGGGFESAGTAWSTSGRATFVNDNEPWQVSGNGDDHRAASLPAGSSISSDSFCGGIDHPTVRLFARSAGLLPGLAAVTIRYTGANDHLLAALPLGVITTTSKWRPTDANATLSGVKLLTGTRMAITVTALTGTVLVDDVYVDPYRRS